MRFSRSRARTEPVAETASGSAIAVRRIEPARADDGRVVVATIVAPHATRGLVARELRALADVVDAPRRAGVA